MARKTFISYKYSEAQETRDSIIEALGNDASYYQGETSESPDIGDTSTENIKKALADMLYGTSVTIVVISPNMTDSNWIDWEINYSLKKITRENGTSQRNGVVGVIQKINGNYDWLIEYTNQDDGCRTRNYDSSKLYNIVTENRSNQVPKEYHCDSCKSIHYLNGSYIALVKEEDFISNPDTYIENAYEKSGNTFLKGENSEGYEITLQ